MDGCNSIQLYHYYYYYFQVKSLPPPYKSKCANKKIFGTSAYSKPLCIEECRTRFIISKCHCRSAEMQGNQFNLLSHLKTWIFCLYSVMYKEIVDANLECKFCTCISTFVESRDRSLFTPGVGTEEIRVGYSSFWLAHWLGKKKYGCLSAIKKSKIIMHWKIWRKMCSYNTFCTKIDHQWVRKDSIIDQQERDCFGALSKFEWAFRI
jgi:hypothetical protein